MFFKILFLPLRPYFILSYALESSYTEEIFVSASNLFAFKLYLFVTYLYFCKALIDATCIRTYHFLLLLNFERNLTHQRAEDQLELQGNGNFLFCHTLCSFTLLGIKQQNILNRI